MSSGGPEVTLMASYINPSQSHAEQSCQCMNAALLLSAVLIMAPVTALINTITSHWKSLTGKKNCVRAVGGFSRGGGVHTALRKCVKQEGSAGRTDTLL